MNYFALGLIYIIGGMDKDYGFGSELTTVESFNPVTKEWEELPPMNTPRANASVSTLNGYIYVMGGFNTRDGDLASMERFSPEEVRPDYCAEMKFFKKTREKGNLFLRLQNIPVNTAKVKMVFLITYNAIAFPTYTHVYCIMWTYLRTCELTLEFSITH